MVKSYFKTVFEQADKKTKDGVKAAHFKNFRNALRKDLTENWSQTGNQLVNIEYKSGYINELEKALFDELNKSE